MTAKKSKNIKDLLAGVPDTGIARGRKATAAADHVSQHPEDWKPLHLSTRGRPKHGQETGSVVKSIRFPKEVWAMLAAKAKAQHVNLHGALRAAVLDWAKKH